MTTLLPIIIIGAGIGGLALAQGFAKNGVPFKVYEADSSLHARTQGYRVRITDEGIDALQENLSEDHFGKIMFCCNVDVGPSNVPQANIDALTGEIGQPLFKPGQRTPILAKLRRSPLSADRGMLRRILLEGIENHVVFGCRFQSYNTANKDTISAHFEDGSEVLGSILVGADGVWSKVRRQLLPSTPLLDTEARLVFGKTDMTDAFSREFSETALKGLTFVRDNCGLACLLEPMRFPDNSKIANYVYWVLFLRADGADTPEDITSLSLHECAALSHRLASGWHPSLRAMFNHANDGGVSVVRVLSSSPELMRAAHASLNAERVTLLGDASHAMCPTAALGATTALRDSMTLLSSLKKHGWKPTALRDYEAAMIEYASDALRGSLVGGKNIFNMKPFDELPEVQVRL